HLSLVLKCEILWRVLIWLDLWIFGRLEFNRIPQRLLQFSLRLLRWMISMRFLSCIIRISADDIRRLLSSIFTAKRTVLRIIWPISVILLLLDFILLIYLIGDCPSGFVITLLVCHSLGVLVF
ncbi:hypothetical protein LINGRAHAP2_LOCUS18906, partial [Linum grandiflorum]